VSAETHRAKAEAKPILTIAGSDGFRKGSTHSTGCDLALRPRAGVFRCAGGPDPLLAACLTILRTRATSLVGGTPEELRSFLI
jgi:hypothetical protein